ncbi:hypothetical protein Tco_0083931 [Tanacetum coccineum]
MKTPRLDLKEKGHPILSYAYFWKGTTYMLVIIAIDLKVDMEALLKSSHVPQGCHRLGNSPTIKALLAGIFDFSKLPFYDTFALKKRLRFVFSGMETLWSIPFNPHIKRKIFDCGSDLIAPTGLALNACGDASDFSIGWQSRAKEKTSIFKIYTMLARLYERGLLKARSCGGSYLLKNFDIEISRQKKELENLAADHLS